MKFPSPIPSATWLLLLLLPLILPAAAEIADDMGPAAFLWPPDRTWSSATDNTAPCGSAAGVGNRTDYPLSGGKVALVDQDEGYDVQLSISFSNDPTSNSDFSGLIAGSRLAELDLGHTCVSIADPPSNISAGDNATLQIVYTALFDSLANQTFYACADVVYVAAADFTGTEYCFNATESSSSGSSSSSSAAAATTTVVTEGGGSAGMSKGAIAGAVVGSVVGAALLAGAALWYGRKLQQTQKKARLAEMELRARDVHPEWEQGRAGAAVAGKRVSSQGSV